MGIDTHCDLCGSDIGAVPIRLAHGAVIGVCDYCVPEIKVAWTYATSCSDCRADLRIGCDNEGVVIRDGRGIRVVCEACFDERHRTQGFRRCVYCDGWHSPTVGGACPECGNFVCEGPGCEDAHSDSHRRCESSPHAWMP